MGFLTLIGNTVKPLNSPLVKLRYTHWIFCQTNAWVRTPFQFHFITFLWDGWYPKKNTFSKSIEPFMSYQPSSTGHAAHLGRMAGAAWLVTQKGLIGFQKILFHWVSTNNWVHFEVKLGWCSDLIICSIKYQVCSQKGSKSLCRFTSENLKNK